MGTGFLRSRSTGTGGSWDQSGKSTSSTSSPSLGSGVGEASWLNLETLRGWLAQPAALSSNQGCGSPGSVNPNRSSATREDRPGERLTPVKVTASFRLWGLGPGALNRALRVVTLEDRETVPGVTVEHHSQTSDSSTIETCCPSLLPCNGSDALTGERRPPISTPKALVPADCLASLARAVKRVDQRSADERGGQGLEGPRRAGRGAPGNPGAGGEAQGSGGSRRFVPCRRTRPSAAARSIPARSRWRWSALTSARTQPLVLTSSWPVSYGWRRWGLAMAQALAASRCSRPKAKARPMPCWMAI
jgi:hypothetical protein